MHGLYESRSPGVVAKRLAQIVHIILDKPLRYVDIAPDSVEDMILGQQAVGTLDQQAEYLKGLVAYLNGLTPVPKALIGEVNLEIGH
jgi:hypothetical protein